ncbi:Glutathione transport system permease protein gsiD [Serratia fonticola]|uniref:Glutathione transport system permease protein gsiD n=1 Tax=Serratia fonticola TaxID=47917 RepID=A0A4U9TKY7_SERFO|nr:Glutathione transport system permease protein gsiD [Serratia fonticola]
MLPTAYYRRELALARHDSYGRDVLSRLIYGTRPTLGLVLLVTAITLPLGLLIGVLSGYYGGWLERVLMRLPTWSCRCHG